MLAPRDPGPPDPAGALRGTRADTDRRAHPLPRHRAAVHAAVSLRLDVTMSLNGVIVKINKYIIVHYIH